MAHRSASFLFRRQGSIIKGPTSKQSAIFRSMFCLFLGLQRGAEMMERKYSITYSGQRGQLSSNVGCQASTACLSRCILSGWHEWWSRINGSAQAGLEPLRDHGTALCCGSSSVKTAGGPHPPAVCCTHGFGACCCEVITVLVHAQYLWYSTR